LITATQSYKYILVAENQRSKIEICRLYLTNLESPGENSNIVTLYVLSYCVFVILM